MIREGEERANQVPRRGGRNRRRVCLLSPSTSREISGIKLREIGDKRRQIELADELMSEILFSGSTILNSFTVKKWCKIRIGMHPAIRDGGCALSCDKDEMHFHWLKCSEHLFIRILLLGYSSTSTRLAIRNAIRQQAKGWGDFQPELDMLVWTPYVSS